MSHQCRVNHLRVERLVAALNDVPDHDADVAAGALGGVRLRHAAPAAIQQDACRRHARGRWYGLLADDPGKHLDAKLGVPPRQRPQIGRQSLSGQVLTGWAYPPPVGAATAPPARATTTRIM